MAKANSTASRICAKCGRVVIGPRCKQCRKAYMRDWCAANPDKKKAASVTYRSANRKKLAAKTAAWYEKNGEKAAKWRESHRDDAKARVSAWRTANPERVKAWYVANAVKESVSHAARYAANTETHKAMVAAWAAANPEKKRIYNQNRRANKAASGGKLSPGLAEKLFNLQRGKCACCGKPLGKDYHLDHRMPLALGGTNTDDNMQLLTATCNMQKHTADPIDFMQSRGFLL